MNTTTSAPPPKLLWQREPADWNARPCLGTPIELWFGPEDGRRESPEEAAAREEEAKDLCAWCPVVEFCLETELALSPFDQHGIRAGLTADERRALIRRRARRSGRATRTEAVA
ncbi:hypothetical protein GCM10009678_05060 [Actinomadura kijaniata]|uniref:4Fe-4S Wbl-type domain-containing protein n=1 Tax=Actinomadura namibiensis TaxID=182080 RepID=A0A7W3LTE1_ACTNM|nr:WhiB family transcriptional regulator [Actinomadura namibiensis]MBA8953930.1 hypothetical protein [Actinomadura namibiensis]